MQGINFDDLEKGAQKHQLQTDPDDGFPVFPDLERCGVSLSADERLVLGQIVQLDGKWSIANLADLHKQLCDAFAAESGQPYTPEIAAEYIAPIRVALESLRQKGLVELVPGQPATDLGSDQARWQRKA